MSIYALNLAFKADIPKSSTKFVFIAMADYANEDMELYPTLEALVAKTSLDKKTIMSAIADMISCGFLVDTGIKKGKTGRTKVYKLLIEMVPILESYQKRNDSVFSHKEYQKRDDLIVPKTDIRTLNNINPYITPSINPPINIPPKESDPLTQGRGQIVPVLPDHATVPKKKPPRSPSSSKVPEYSDEFLLFWERYPRRDGSKREAFVSYTKAINEGVSHEAITSGVFGYAQYVSREGLENRFIKHAQTWLNQRCWESDYHTVRRNIAPGKSQQAADAISAALDSLDDESNTLNALYRYL